MTIVICQECNDAPAVTRRRFNGAALYDLCEGCADHWDVNALTNPATDEQANPPASSSYRPDCPT